MFSKRSLEGEVIIDHSASPGLSAEFVELCRRNGKEIPHAAGGQVYESATVTCSHCQRVVILNPDRTRARTWCAKCDRYICDLCAVAMKQTLECRNIRRVLDDLQNAAERGESVVLVP